jgi:transcriptional regulator with GAF, ATPase, and Fis domain
VTGDDELFADSTTIAQPQAIYARLNYPFVLTIAEGLDRGAALTVDASHPTRILVGKSTTCQMRLQDPSVSRRHVAIEVVAQRLRVTDLASTNGTFVDGVAIVQVYLSGGETIRLGATAIQVTRGQPTPAASLSRAASFGTTMGTSFAMRRLYPLCERLATSNLPVIIEGETGTGKEQLAESLHRMSPRAAGPLIVFDCTAVAPNLIESELFGHERGAFTGSVATHQGVFEQASGGTLLIDEIGDLPLELQPKLLRVIERMQVRRVGGRDPIEVDVRLIAATRRDLDRLVQLGRFRDDLFHRVAVARIELPPLREREGDVELLARRFWADYGGDPDAIPADLLRDWEDYNWPGNVRELRNAVARRMALGDLAPLSESSGSQPPATAAHGSQPIAAGGDPIAAVLALDLPLAETRQRVVDEVERRYVERVLAAHNGNVTRAAAAAGVARRYFHRLKAKVSGRSE